VIVASTPDLKSAEIFRLASRKIEVVQMEPQKNERLHF